MRLTIPEAIGVIALTIGALFALDWAIKRLDESRARRARQDRITQQQQQRQDDDHEQ